MVDQAGELVVGRQRRGAQHFIRQVGRKDDFLPHTRILHIHVQMPSIRRVDARKHAETTARPWRKILDMGKAMLITGNQHEGHDRQKGNEPSQRKRSRRFILSIPKSGRAQLTMM